MSAQTKGNPTMLVSLEEMAPVIEAGLAQGQEVVLTVTGNSMAPFLRHQRDQVVLTATDPTALQPGDVPLYRRRNGQFVLHRIVERDDGTCRRRLGDEDALPSAHVGAALHFTMLGDAQTDPEPRIETDQIIACAAAFLHKGKRLDCDSRRYCRRVRRWHRWLPERRVLMWLYYLPERLCRLPGRVYRKIKRCIPR